MRPRRISHGVNIAEAPSSRSIPDGDRVKSTETSPRCFFKTVPHVPLSHPFVERLIGTTRRELLDHFLFWNARDLGRKLADFQTYYNGERAHASLAGNTPDGIASGRLTTRAALKNVRWTSHCRGLVQLPAPPDDEVGPTGFSCAQRVSGV